MSCPPEVQYSIYVDGELGPVESRDLEAHLVGCQRCRALILSLEEEGTLLAGLLQARPDATAQSAPARVRARGLVGVLPSLGVAALVLTVLGTMLEQRLPPGFSWLNPINLMGAYEMFFDAIFMLRDRAPTLFDLAIAVGATVGIAAVFTFLAGALVRRVLTPGPTASGAALLLLACVGLGAATPARAVDVRLHEDSVTVGVGEVLRDTLVVSAQRVDIDGVLEGNLIAMTERLTVRGEVRGAVFALARETEIAGKIDGSVHLVCERCSIEGEVTSSVYACGEKLYVESGGVVGRDVFFFGEDARMGGEARRDVVSAADRVEIRGTVGRNATAYASRVSVADGAVIAGDLTIETPEGHEPEIASGAHIAGETMHSVLEHRMPEQRNRWLTGKFYLRTAVFLVSAFLVGMLLHLLVPRLFTATVETTGDFFRCLGWGFVALVGTPIALIFCFVSVVGIPIGVIGIFVYLTTLFVSVIVVAALIGSSITGAEPRSSQGFGTALLLGLAIVAVAMNVPFLGGVLRLLVMLTGLGLMIVVGRSAWASRGRPQFA